MAETTIPDASQGDTNPRSDGFVVHHGDVAIVGSIQDLVECSPVIFIGTIEGSGGVINLARNVNDISQPDAHLFHLGQEYSVRVERFIRGEGASIQHIVQMEGMYYDEDRALPDTVTSDLVAASRQHYSAYIPFVAGERYLFFVKPAPELGSEPGYLVTSYGQPWRFILPEGGTAQPDTLYDEVKELYPSQAAESLIRQVEDLVHTQP